MLIGMQAVYLDAGSGASRAVSAALVRAARAATRGTLFVGGGVRNAAAVRSAREAGADYVVVGTVVERDGSRAVRELADAASVAARVGA
jgi:heptaprenylglyceryl phosphate synthase